MNTPLEIALDIHHVILETSLARTLLDVPRCAERISRRHPLADCSREQIEEVLEQEGIEAGLSMRLAGRGQMLYRPAAGL